MDTSRKQIVRLDGIDIFKNIVKFFRVQIIVGRMVTDEFFQLRFFLGIQVCMPVFFIVDKCIYIEITRMVNQLKPFICG